MSRNRNMRYARRSHLRERPRDNFGQFRSDEHHRWDVSPTFQQHNERGGWDEGHYRRQPADFRPTHYQYYSDREEYPGPGPMQGFGREGEDRGQDYGQRWNESYHQPRANEEYRDMRNMSEYGYGSGRTELPSRQAGRTWDERSDESYSWGDHQGDRRSGEHRGKGPKGYKRLDERIREEVNDRLCYDDRIDASEIVVSVQDGEVSLTGTVSDRASKRRAEDIVEEISGVSHVENRIRVGTVTPEEPISRERQNREVPNGKSKALQDR